MTEVRPTSVEESPVILRDQNGLLDQFILLGDSITQHSSNQELGFAFQPALQNGKLARNVKQSLPQCLLLCILPLRRSKVGCLYVPISFLLLHFAL